MARRPPQRGRSPRESREIGRQLWVGICDRFSTGRLCNDDDELGALVSHDETFLCTRLDLLHVATTMVRKSPGVITYMGCCATHTLAMSTMARVIDAAILMPGMDATLARLATLSKICSANVDRLSAVCARLVASIAGGQSSRTLKRTISVQD
jgi:hypothetical protein